MIPGLRTYDVSSAARQPLIDFMVEALQGAGCTILHHSSPDLAPFVIGFETAKGERLGIVAYAFRATRTPTKNRPKDERSFQIKYGSKAGYAENNSHELWLDPVGIFTTLFIGIDPDEGFCVSADPVVHNPTKFFIRLEFKDEHAEAVKAGGWHAWQRVKRRPSPDDLQVETLVGAKKERFLDLIRFERASRDLDPGNRLILAEQHALPLPSVKEETASVEEVVSAIASEHPLIQQLGLSVEEVLDLIMNARRLKMAVRGFVAEEHLRSALSKVPGVTSCERLEIEGGPDISLRYREGPPLTVECKSAAREPYRDGSPRVDFQRTRASKGNPCSRYYEPTDFDIVAACLHALTAQWDFRFALAGNLPPHRTCEGRIDSNIRVDKNWIIDAEQVFQTAYAAKGEGV